MGKISKSTPPKLRVSPPLQKCSKVLKKKLFFGNSEVKVVLNSVIRDENHIFAILGVKLEQKKKIFKMISILLDIVIGEAT